MGCCCCCCCCCCLVRCRPPLPQQIRASHDLGLKFQLSSGRALRGTMGRSAVVVGRHSSVHLVTTAYINSSDDDDDRGGQKADDPLGKRFFRDSISSVSSNLVSLLSSCYSTGRPVLVKSGSKPFNSTKASVAAVRDLDHYKSYNMPSLCDDPLYAQTLRSVISAGPSDVWPLKHGRVIVFLEGRPFALAANNESLAAIARE
jgi:hypothetical protein